MSVNIILPENFDEIYHEINTLIIDKKRRKKGFVESENSSRKFTEKKNKKSETNKRKNKQIYWDVNC